LVNHELLAHPIYIYTELMAELKFYEFAAQDRALSPLYLPRNREEVDQS
jgi:hypothetical protein